MTRPPRALLLGAFAVVYLVWGSTYLAIHVAVQTLPPLCMAGGLLACLVGGAMGEWPRLLAVQWSRPALLALAYLVVFGSILGFAAYNWLLGVASPAAVSTYAYVNPVVAVLLGAVFLGESVGMGTLVAAGMILTSVALITWSGSAPAARPARRAQSPLPCQEGVASAEA